MTTTEEIYGGCFAATISSAIASMVGAPRVLQALAKDKLYPKIELFAPGVGVNDNPVRGFILVFFISLTCILLGDLNIICSLLSNFFVAVYALVNFSVFHASITKSPSSSTALGCPCLECFSASSQCSPWTGSRRSSPL